MDEWDRCGFSPLPLILTILLSPLPQVGHVVLSLLIGDDVGGVFSV